MPCICAAITTEVTEVKIIDDRCTVIIARCQQSATSTGTVIARTIIKGSKWIEVACEGIQTGPYLDAVTNQHKIKTAYRRCDRIGATDMKEVLHPFFALPVGRRRQEIFETRICEEIDLVLVVISSDAIQVATVPFINAQIGVILGFFKTQGRTQGIPVPMMVYHSPPW